jgi:hypothetical protein
MTFNYHPNGISVRELKALLNNTPETDHLGKDTLVKIVTEQGIRNVVQSCTTNSLVLLELGITRSNHKGPNPHSHERRRKK